MTYVPLHYYSYNFSTVILSISILLLFIIFFAILFLAFMYEISNKTGYCEPTFYYGQACRNQIANTVLTDPQFLEAKHAFYQSIKDPIDPKLETIHNTIEDISGAIQSVLTENNEFNTESVNQIQEVTNALNLITANYLGNIKQLFESSQDKSNTVITSLKQIPQLISSVQDKINQAIVKPASARLVIPLRKLHSALTAVQNRV